MEESSLVRKESSHGAISYGMYTITQLFVTCIFESIGTYEGHSPGRKKAWLDKRPE